LQVIYCSSYHLVNCFRLSEVPVCPYYETGHCDKGNLCPFVHGDICDLCNVPCLHPANEGLRAEHRRECIAAHEAAMEEAFAEARSADKVCGICMENIREKNVRFGILEGCKHCFCLDCIRQWRSNQNHHFEKKTVRSCPECRTHSDFVIPAKYWVEDPADKSKLIAKFRENTKQKLCKYVKGGRIGNCPFGNKCFYKHVTPDGTVVEGDSPRTLRRYQTSDVDFGKYKFVCERKNAVLKKSPLNISAHKSLCVLWNGTGAILFVVFIFAGLFMKALCPSSGISLDNWQIISAIF
uniref:RING-type E3 ubiquitin transferase n=1 Tax=Gongylonema pulchrum TaxID=637853 RepID=A0A183D6Y2_9BILA